MIDRDKALGLTQTNLEQLPLSTLREVAEAIGADTIGCENRLDVVLVIMARQATWKRRLAG